MPRRQVGHAGVIGEFVTHWLYARATEREQHLSDAESAERQLTIARLSSEVAVANARAAEAGATAEHLRRENLELQRRIQPREIAADVRPSVVTGLARHRGQKFVIVAGASDAEGSVFAARLLDVLLAAGWMAQREGVSYGAMLELIVGVDIRVGDSPGAIAAGEALREALALAAISANVRPADRHTDSKGKVHTYPEEDALSVDVGVKPIPEMKR